MFGLKYKESFSYCVLGTEKVWKYFMFITWMVNKLNHFGRSIDSSMWNYKLLIKRTLSAINFCLVKKIQPKKRSLFKQNVNLIEQKLKFAVYCLYYFCTILYLLFEKKKFCSSVLFRRHQETFLFDCHGNFVMIDTHPNMLITTWNVIIKMKWWHTGVSESLRKKV